MWCIEFEDKLSLTLGVKEENIPYEDRRLEDAYQAEVGDILFEKTMQNKRTYPTIPQDKYKEIHRIWSHKGDITQLAAKHDHIKESLSYRTFKTISGLSWLNDEVNNIIFNKL